jgi:hypothetical protein
MRSRRSRPSKKPFRKPFPKKIRQRPEPVPARLHVILAREAPKAVIFRRGPSGQVCTVGWDLETDTFTTGQWLKGRIYEYRSDLSPDGELMIYFATDFRRPDTIRQYAEKLREEKFGPRDENGPDQWKDISRQLKETGEQLEEINRTKSAELARFAATPEASAPSWTAISRAPYLKALDLWFNGTAWNGGGLFLDNRKAWLNAPAPGIATLRRARFDLKLDISQDFPFDTYYGGECPGVYFPRLLRDGWTAKHQAENSIVYEKPLAFGWALQKLFVNGPPRGSGYGCYWERHRIINPVRRLKIDGTGWRWADYDAPRSRILYAKNGMLFALPVAEDFGTPVMLRNFNDMKFEPLKAPY